MVVEPRPAAAWGSRTKTLDLFLFLDLRVPPKCPLHDAFHQGACFSFRSAMIGLEMLEYSARHRSKAKRTSALVSRLLDQTHVKVPRNKYQGKV